MPVRKAPTATVRIPPEEYAAFAALVADPNDFPPTHAEWFRRHQEFEALRRARGEELTEVVVSYADFAAYCEAVGLRPSKYALLGCMSAVKGGWKRT